ncbi:MAG: 2-C-methyl-D-erythritol 4-phosphate cytidylyltransferase [Vicingaceae bacterium]
MEQVVIIVAGGKGLRMGSQTPKQFLEINGKAIIIHTIEKFKQALPSARLVLVLPKNELPRWQSLADKHKISGVSCVAGGKTRFDSVKAGLTEVKCSSLVAIHDAVRPFVSIETIKDCMRVAEKNGAAIPVINLNDSIRKVTNDGSFAVDRSEYKLVQTPQCFKSEILVKAYAQNYQQHFTDDASVVESIGQKVRLTVGNHENIKLTNPADLKWANSLFL